MFEMSKSCCSRQACCLACSCRVKRPELHKELLSELTIASWEFPLLSAIWSLFFFSECFWLIEEKRHCFPQKGRRSPGGPFDLANVTNTKTNNLLFICLIEEQCNIFHAKRQPQPKRSFCQNPFHFSKRCRNTKKKFAPSVLLNKQMRQKDTQSCIMSQIWQIYLCKNIKKFG